MELGFRFVIRVNDGLAGVETGGKDRKEEQRRQERPPQIPPVRCRYSPHVPHSAALLSSPFFWLRLPTPWAPSGKKQQKARSTDSSKKLPFDQAPTRSTVTGFPQVSSL